jgi:transposase
VVLVFEPLACFKELTVNSIGCDLHRKSITLCVVNTARQVIGRKTFYNYEVAAMVTWLTQWRPFQIVVEATAHYEWFWQKMQGVAERILLAHPGKLRIIAESTRKTDRIDAQILAEFLALDMIPPAYRPTSRERAHRRLVRHYTKLRGRTTSVRCRIRSIVADYNADQKDLFSLKGQSYLTKLPVITADRFVLRQLMAELRFLEKQITALQQCLRKFAKAAGPREAAARQVLDSIPGVGPVTIDVVVSELGDVGRFRSVKKAQAYAGLAPGMRESAGKRRELHITKTGSPLLRWALVEAAWRLVALNRRWRMIFEALARRRGKKRAIVAVARRLLGVMVSLLQRGEMFKLAA